MAGIKGGYTSQSIPVQHITLGGGLNTASGPLNLQDNEASDLLNVDFDKFGSVLKRSGYTLLNTTRVASTTDSSLYWYVTGTSRYAMKITGALISRMDNLDGTWDDITSSGNCTITGGYLFSFETFLGNLYATNNYDIPIRYIGSGYAFHSDTSASGNITQNLTRAKFVTKFQNYLLYANITIAGVNRPSRFYWSAIKNDTSWSATDFIEVSMNDGEEITGFKVLGANLVIYKINSIYIVSFTGDSTVPFIMQKSNSSVGCVAPYSIQEVDNGHVFLAYDGLYYFDGNNSYKMSDRINDTINGLNKDMFPKVVSMYQRTKNQYYLGVYDAGKNVITSILTWNSFNNAFSKYDGFSASGMSIFLVNGVEERPYFSDYNGYTYRADTGNTDYPFNTATNINGYFYTNWKSYDDICDMKGIPHTYIYYKKGAGTLTFSYEYDFNTDTNYSTSFSTNSTLGVSSLSKRMDLTGRGRVVRFKLSSNSTTNFRIDGIGEFAHLETKQ